MWNYASGSVNMIRAEVQSADVSIEDNKVVGSSHGNSGTNLILLSDDDTGFMPYRIDNFSMEVGNHLILALTRMVFYHVVAARHLKFSKVLTFSHDL